MSSMAVPNFEALFRTFQIGNVALRNRIVMAPMSVLVEQWTPKELSDVTKHFRRCAEGEMGLILSGAILVDDPAADDGSLNVTNLHDAESLAAWSSIVREVQAAGAPMMAQLFHSGVWRDQANSANPGLATLTPSGIGPTGEKIGQPATQKEIDRVIDAFVRSAVNAKNAGFSGIELAAGHGYLIDHFLWALRNQRDDRYGGSIENRSRFAVEIIEAIRHTLGPDFPILARISQYKRDDIACVMWQTPQEMEAALAPLVRAGVDAFHCSGWQYAAPGLPAPHPPLSFAAWVKKITGKPVITVGSVGLDKGFMETWEPGARTVVSGLEPLTEAMERGDFDLVALGRALLADPAWARKVREGQVAAIKPFVRPAKQSLTASAHEYVE